MKVPAFVSTIFLVNALDAALLMALPLVAMVHPYLMIVVLMVMLYFVPLLSLATPLSALRWQRTQGCPDLSSQLAWQMCPAGLWYLALCGVAQAIPHQLGHFMAALFFIWVMIQVFRLTGGALVATLLSLPLYWKLRHRPADRIQAGAAGLAASGGIMLLHLQLMPKVHQVLEHLPCNLQLQSGGTSPNYTVTLVYLLISTCYFLAWGASMQWWIRLKQLEPSDLG